jgi:hypothetical protein
MAADIYPGQLPIEDAISAGMQQIGVMWEEHAGRTLPNFGGGDSARIVAALDDCGVAPVTFDSGTAFATAAKVSFAEAGIQLLNLYGYHGAVSRLAPLFAAWAFNIMDYGLAGPYSHANMKGALVLACAGFLKILQDAIGIPVARQWVLSGPELALVHAVIDPYIVHPV